MNQRQFQRTYIREWRKYRNLTLEKLGARIPMAAGNLSRLERGLNPYIQYQLEAIADALRCTVADLTSRPPGAASELLDVVSTLPPEKQKQALRIIQALADVA